MKKIFKISLILIIPLAMFSWAILEKSRLSIKDIEGAEKVINLNFTEAEKDSMISGLRQLTKSYEQIRNYSLDNSVPPAYLFNPIPLEMHMEKKDIKNIWSIPEDVSIPDNLNDLAFYSIPELASLIKNGKISSKKLTEFFISRLKKYGDTLKCVVTITEDLAYQQAEKADQLLKEEIYKGILHGIPYGVKDLLAVPGYPTTWGANPYKEQEFDYTATVVQKLNEAGAVLIAKLSMGALAWGDVWFNGITKNPWDLTNGSSGSSAGSASATAAGLVPFSIGTETWGSIVSPSSRCGVTGLRPTFGRVSRSGAMALSWTMDKIGPIARSARDCAIVFDIIRGKDGIDQSVIEAPFIYSLETQLGNLRLGYFESLFNENYPNKNNDQKTLNAFRNLGFELIPVELPENIPTDALSLILDTEAAAAFDVLTRSNQDSMLVRQIKNAWPNEFRKSRFIPAVEYINANRIRFQLIQDLNVILKDYDAIISPSFGGDQLLMTNLTGHPCIVFPNGFSKNGRLGSISIIGNLYDEAKILFLAEKYQEITDFENKHPTLFQ